MGIETECFVHPERISPELFCPICTQVLQNPVQTPSEHLFCEDELLEWLTRSDVCPVTKTKLNPASISQPGRIILNMLGELDRWCPNKSIGCSWTGPHSQVSKHIEMCTYKSREDLLSRIEEKDGIIEKLKKKLSKCERMLSETEETCVGLQTRLDYVETKLKVYDAFFRDSRNGPRPDFVVDDAEVDGDNSSYKATDLQRLSRLQHLSSLSVSNTADSK